MKKLYLAKIGERFIDPASGTEYQLVDRNGSVWDVLSSNGWSEEGEVVEWSAQLLTHDEVCKIVGASDVVLECENHLVRDIYATEISGDYGDEYVVVEIRVADDGDTYRLASIKGEELSVMGLLEEHDLDEDIIGDSLTAFFSRASDSDWRRYNEIMDRYNDRVKLIYTVKGEKEHG